VQDALLQTVKFWLDLGVDGYRLDTVNFYFHDAQLRDNPPRGRPDGEDPAVNSVNPYGWQWHQFDKSQPENLAFLQKLRALLDAYPNTTMVGEIGDDHGLERVAEYTNGGDKLHMAYCFDLLGTAHSSEYFHGVLSRFESLAQGGWPCWALSNHDVARHATRWTASEPNANLLRLGAAMQLSLRGSACLYQGDELGLPEADIAFEDIKDPYGITMWPEFKGRDGCRTPMPWNASSADFGFSMGNQPADKPWLPVSESHRSLAVDLQDATAASLLNFYRGLIRWRRTQPALIDGDLQLLPVHTQILAYLRSHGSQRVLCVFNFSGESTIWSIPSSLVVTRVMDESGLTGCTLQEGRVSLIPWGGAFLLLG
jgi:alpha-glucosidase